MSDDRFTRTEVPSHNGFNHTTKVSYHLTNVNNFFLNILRMKFRGLGRLVCTKQVFCLLTWISWENVEYWMWQLSGLQLYLAHIISKLSHNILYSYCSDVFWRINSYIVGLIGYDFSIHVVTLLHCVYCTTYVSW